MKTFLEKLVKEKVYKVLETDLNGHTPFGMVKKEPTKLVKVFYEKNKFKMVQQYAITIRTYSNIEYDEIVVGLIREKYSQDEEYSIIRKKLADIDYKDQFIEYNSFVEECKTKATDFVRERKTFLSRFSKPKNAE